MGGKIKVLNLFIYFFLFINALKYFQNQELKTLLAFSIFWDFFANNQTWDFIKGLALGKMTGYEGNLPAWFDHLKESSFL